MIHLILQGVVPVVFVLALGFYAGRKNVISEEGARNFSTYVLNFGLPCSLFVGIFGFSARQLGNIPFILAKGAIICAACPSATFGAMLSAEMHVGQNTIPPEILVSNILGIFSIAFWVFIAEQL